MRLLPLRGRWLLYLLALHLGLGGLVFWHLRERPWWFLGLEVALAVSLLLGLALSRRADLPRELLRTGSELIREEEFGSRLAGVGDREAAEVVGLFNRMMERLRRERLLVQEREQLLGEVVRASPAAFLTLDHDGRADLVNPAAERLFGRGAAGPAGRTLGSIDHPLARALADLSPGESRLVDLQGRRLRAAHGRFYNRGFARSFYLVEELTAELRATERAAYDKLIRMISHEVNNSVGAVVSLLQSTAGLAAELPPPRRERAERALAVAEDRLRSLDRFVDGFAEVVRLPAPDRRPIDLDRLLDDLLVLLGPDLAERRIAVRWLARPERPATVSADKNQLEQALVNVLRNAMEAMGEDGEIALSLDRRDGAARLTIADTGPGIPESVRSRLFVPFVSTKRDGRGLGLTLIREILEGHGFGYGLEDRPEGGAVFRLEVPAEAGGGPRQEGGPRPASGTAGPAPDHPPSR